MWPRCRGSLSHTSSYMKITIIIRKHIQNELLFLYFAYRFALPFGWGDMPSLRSMFWKDFLKDLSYFPSIRMAPKSNIKSVLELYQNKTVLIFFSHKSRLRHDLILTTPKTILMKVDRFPSNPFLCQVN